MNFFSTAALLTLLFYFLLRFLKRIRRYAVILYHVHKVPGPPTESFLWGNVKSILACREKGFQVFRRYSLHYFPICKQWMGPVAVCLILHPEDIKLVLANSKHLEKPILYNSVRGWLRNGALVGPVKIWRPRRKVLLPTFHYRLLRDFIGVFNEKTLELVETLKKEVGKPHTEVNEIIGEFALQTIEETVLGTKVSPANKYLEAHSHLSNFVSHRNQNLYLLVNWIYFFTTNFFREWKVLRNLHRFTDLAVKGEEQRRQSVEKKTILDLLLKRKMEGAIDHLGICEEVDGLLFGGHNTITAAISFGLMEFACHPEIQDEVLQEMQRVLGDSTKPPTYEDLRELHYLERCIKEVLRLYPSVPRIARTLGEDVVCSGYKLKKGTFVQISIFDLHRNPELFPEPEKFDPDRFLPENCRKRHAFAYLPFSAGPRNCLGQKFSMLELKSVFCAILGNFRLEAVDTPERVAFVMDVVLRTKENVKVKFVPRF